MYEAIHKGLRLFMGDTLARVGRVDVFDAEEMAATLGQLNALLDFCLRHIEHENEFLHTAIRARQPAGASRTSEDHLEHLQTIEQLRMEAALLLAAPEEERMAMALRLYRHLALFVAENLQHMHVEETANNAALWAHYTDDELMHIHARLQDSISPPDLLHTLRWIVPGLSPVQRAGLMGAVKAQLPAPAFEQLMGTVQPHLDMTAWSKLTRALGVAQHPGLVDFI